VPPVRERHRRRRAAAARRRRRTVVRLAIVLCVAIVLAAGLVTAGGRGRRGAPPPRAAVARAVVLHPPPPIPGYLLIADRGNNRMLLVDGRKRIYWRYPGAVARAMPFRFDDDTFFGPRYDRIISNQEDQDTIQVIGFPSGRILWRYGHVDVKSGRPGYLDTPDDAYLLRSGLVTVADAYNCRVLWISPRHRIVRQYGTTGVCRHDPPRALGPVNGATPLPDGGTLISEIPGSWIDDVAASGRLRWAVQAPVSYPSDPQLLGPDRILLADYSHPGAALIMTRRGRVLWKYAPTSGSGELDHPSLAMPLAPGLIAINDDYRDRVVVVSIKTRRIVWQYGHTDRPGTRPGFLDTPDGMDLLPTRAAQRSPRLVRLFSPRRPAPRVATRPSSAALRIAVPYRLPAPVQREVAVADGRSILLAGGLAADSSSTDGVFRLDPATGRLTPLGTVPHPFHDAAGAVVDGRLYVFGGGDAATTATVQDFDPATRRGTVAGRLPLPLSDLAATTVAGAVYLVGGYDGRRPQRAIYRTLDGRHFARVGTLPVGLRYPAVAGVDGGILVAGGTGPGGASDLALFFDPADGRLTRIGRLPAPVAHAAAVVLGGIAYVLGGTGSTGAPAGSVVAIDPRSRRISLVAARVPVHDAAAVSLPHAALLIGGATAAGTTSAVRRVARG
jgi:hypothetical protein